MKKALLYSLFCYCITICIAWNLWNRNSTYLAFTSTRNWLQGPLLLWTSEITNFTRKFGLIPWKTKTNSDHCLTVHGGRQNKVAIAESLTVSLNRTWGYRTSSGPGSPQRRPINLLTLACSATLPNPSESTVAALECGSWFDRSIDSNLQKCFVTKLSGLDPYGSRYLLK